MAPQRAGDLAGEPDVIPLEELKKSVWNRRTSQAFAVLAVQSVGVMGDGRTYDSVAAPRAVTTEGFITADWVRLPCELPARVSTWIGNEVKGVNQVLYDASSKPPATICCW